MEVAGYLAKEHCWMEGHPQEEADQVEVDQAEADQEDQANCSTDYQDP